MSSFRNQRLRNHALPMSTAWLFNDIAEAKGRQGLFTRQSPQILKALREAAIDAQTGLFSVAEIQQACPGVSVDMIRLLLQRLKGAKVECVGRGHTAKWRRISIE